jgi:hypothetical protein
MSPEGPARFSRRTGKVARPAPEPGQTPAFAAAVYGFLRLDDDIAGDAADLAGTTPIWMCDSAAPFIPADGCAQQPDCKSAARLKTWA